MNKPSLIAIGGICFLFLGALVISSLSPKQIEQQKPFSIPAQTAGSSSTNSGLPILADAMPAFQGITKWWNTPEAKPLTPDMLKGKVVLVDFWTYSCINCIRTFPFIKAMQERYADKGLVIVGVHTPEFAFEAEATNVEREIKKNGFTHAIALDPNYATWNAYQNHYWPAEYFFDRQGRLRHVHFGEGSYDESEKVIRELLEENGSPVAEMGSAIPTPDFSRIRTEETYFGLARGEAFQGQAPAEGAKTLLHLQTPKLGQWSAEGTWVFQQEYIENTAVQGRFRFHVQANKLHLVMESADGSDKTIGVSVDGKSLDPITVNASDLYDIASFSPEQAHTIELELPAGVRIYAATFS